MTDLSNFPVWNKADALARMMNNETLLNKMMILFASSSPEQIETLKNAIACGDSATTLAEAHILKGTSGNIGAEQLMVLCDDIETAARNQNNDIMQTLALQLDPTFRSLLTELRP